MEKIALVTDSTADLSPEVIKKYNIKIARLKIKYKDKEFIDGVDITAQEIYKNLPIEIPTTSTPTLGEIDGLFKEILDEGYTHVFVLPISSGLSGTINNFRLASEDYSDKLKTAVFDTKSISLGVGYMLIKLGELIKEGKTFDEIEKSLEGIRDSAKLFFTVENLDNLIKGGRIGRIAGGIGNILNLKPIVSIGDDGKYYTVDKVRGSKQVLSSLVKFGNELLDKNRGKITVMHGDNEESAKKLYDALKDHPNLISIDFGTLSPVAGVHSGPTIYAFAFISE